MTEPQTNTDTPDDLQATLELWAENPPATLSAGLVERGLSVETLEEYSRSGLSTEHMETLRKVLVQGAATGDAEDAALLARLTPLLDPRERAWERMMRARSTGETLSATVTEAVKGGVVVDLGVRGFVPASQVGLNVARNLNQFIGRTLKLRVLEVDRKKQTVILSNRVILEEERADKRRSAIGRINEGDEILGSVRRLTDIGAFVDVGGVDGLLHVSEISWKRIEKPSDVLTVGEKVNVKVLRVDPEAGRISLSARRLTPDPWEAARRNFAPGTVTTVKVVATVPQGAVVQLTEDLEGFIPISELAQRRISTPEEAVQVGQELQAIVTDLQPRDRRIVLSVRKLEHKKERQVIDTYQQRVRTTSTSERTTLGDLFGHLFEELQAEEAAAAASANATESAPAEETAAAPAVETADEAAAVDATEEAPATEALDETTPETVDEVSVEQADDDVEGVTEAPEAAPVDETTVGSSEPDSAEETPVGDAVAADNAPADEPADESAAAGTEDPETKAEAG